MGRFEFERSVALAAPVANPRWSTEYGAVMIKRDRGGTPCWDLGWKSIAREGLHPPESSRSLDCQTSAATGDGN